jgi:hypothetical protein
VSSTFVRPITSSRITSSAVVFPATKTGTLIAHGRRARRSQRQLFQLALGWNLLVRPPQWRERSAVDSKIEDVEPVVVPDDVVHLLWLNAPVEIDVGVDDAFLVNQRLAAAFTKEEIGRVATMACGSVYSLKLVKSGGLFEMKRAAAVAAAHGLELYGGCLLESSIGAAAHLAAFATTAQARMGHRAFRSTNPGRGPGHRPAEIRRVRDLCPRRPRSRRADRRRQGPRLRPERLGSWGYACGELINPGPTPNLRTTIRPAWRFFSSTMKGT